MVHYVASMTYVVGSLGSRPAASRSLRGGSRDKGPARREPRGIRHAVDLETGEVACGTIDMLQVFEDLPWQADGEWCPGCEDVVPFD
jgi:hypothetical protein